MRFTKFICMVLLSVMVVYAHAATRTTTVTEIRRGDDVEKRTEVLTIDGDKARLDMYSDKEANKQNAPYLLTIDGGQTWILDDAKDQKSVCSRWDTKEFFSRIGDLIYYAEIFVNAEISVGKLNVMFDEQGPEILGYKTWHMKIVSSIHGEAEFLGFKREYTLEFRDEIWVSPDLKLSPIEQAWVDALSNSGYRKIDRLSQAWNKQVQGTILKQVSEVTIYNITKNEKRTKHENSAITKLETVKPEDIKADFFKAPECKKVTEKEMEGAATEMLKSIAR